MQRSTHRGGFTATELLVVVIVVSLLLALTLPSLAGLRTSSGTDQSLSNLMTLGVAHATYAADFDGRQFTAIVDEMSTFGSSAAQAVSAYAAFQMSLGFDGQDAWHPPLILGWGLFSGGGVILYSFYQSPFGTFGNYRWIQPISFSSSRGLSLGRASFRAVSARPIHDYVGGRFYDETFYAPNDLVVLEVAAACLDSPCEYDGLCTPPIPGVGDTGYWSSYALSPAAMFHPDVMRAEPDGGWQDPWSIDHGFTAPGLFTARYPDLKTQLLEHHWLQSPPAYVCNPSFDPGTYENCEPYYFNHGSASRPAALFYDMSVRLLPNEEVIAADAKLIDRTGFGLWSRDTPLGREGYYGAFAYDGTNVSHHILTTDGILGRDTLAGPPR